MSEVKVAMIAAVARNRVIGNQGDLPWHLPTDFKFYKTQTMGKPLVMGRKTFESLGGPLPGRTNIVVTSARSLAYEGAEIVSDIEQGIALAKTLAQEIGTAEIIINGGSGIYAAAMPMADRLYITHVEAEPEGDTHFPEIDYAQWDAHTMRDYTPDEQDDYAFTITRYERKRSPGFD